MKLIKLLALAAGLGTALPSVISAQTSFGNDANPFGVEVGEPVSAVSIDVDLRSLPVVPEWRPGQSIREAAKRQYYPLETRNPHAPADLRTAPDNLSELQQIWDRLQGPGGEFIGNSRDTRVSINNGSTGVSPGDPVVDVNANYILYGINGSSGTTFTVYDKTGTKLAGPTSFKSLAPSGDPCATSVSDPIIHYDRLANRWFMLEMGGTSSANRLCTYVSKTDNPITGGWWFYGYATPALPDYPHCSVWHNSYVCTANESGSGAKIYAFDRANMLNGATARAAQRFTSVAKLAGYGFQALTPATFMGTAANAPPANSTVILARHNDDEAHAGGSANGSADFIDLYSLNINWTTPSSSSVSTLPRITITEFNSWFRDYSTFDTVPQPSSNSRLDPVREVILNSLVYRNMGSYESIVGNFATNQNAARTGTVVDSGLRWFELRRVGTGNWTLQQEGTFGPGDTSTHHLMGTIATDKQGNIGFGYNVTKTTSPTVSATLRYTGRLAGDPSGVMTQGETDVAVGSAAETSGRWGDYYQMVVDPTDDCTFFFVGSYRPSGSWNTRIADFKFNSCTGGTPTTYSISGTVSTSTGVGISGVTVSRGGASTTTNSSGAYTLGGVSAGNYTLTPSLTGYSFAPATRSVTVGSANVTGQNFTGTAVPVNNQLSNGIGVNSSVNSSSANSDYKEFTVAIPAGASNLTIATSNASGDVDLYTRFGSAPGTASGQYDCRPYTGSGNETCSVASPSAGTYYARVYGYATGTQSFTITATWTEAAATYSVSGTITTSGGAGISGVTVSRGAASTVTNSSGAYSFSGVGNGSYTLTPSLSGYSFSPASRSVTVSGANVSGQNFTGTPPVTTFAVSGTISTSAGAGIGGVLVSAGSASATTNSAGSYTISSLSNGSYTLTPSLSGYSFSPASRSVTVSGANVSGQNFTGTPPVVSNALLNGVPTNSSVNSSSANGDFKDFTIAIPSGASNLLVTTAATPDIDLYVRFGAEPTTSTYDCRSWTSTGNESCSFASPSAGTYYVRVYGYATGTIPFTVTASWALAPSTYSISGSITTSGGAGIGGVSVSRGGVTTTTNSSGAYTFSGVSNGSYTLTPSLTGYTFAPVSRSVTVSGASLSGQNFTGSAATATTFFENTANYTINDNSTILSPISVTGLSGNAPSNLQVSVRIIHTYQGDLQVYLIAPDGSSYTLHNRTGGGTDNLITTYTVNASSESANGTWQLRVRDRASGDTGYLDEWSLQF